MKRIVCILTVVLTSALFSGCYDRGVVDLKDFDNTLPDIENLNYTQEGSVVKLSWTIPSNISPAFRRPLEVSIQKVENDIYREVITVHGENTSFDVSIDTDKKYRFVVKLAGYLLDEAREVGKPDRVYSANARVVEIP